MEIIQNLTSVKGYRGASIAIGNFDGVHLGHQQLIHQAMESAKQHDGPSIVLTFDPHPMKYLYPERWKGLITDNQRKAELMAALGVDAMVVLEFNSWVANMEPGAFYGFIRELFHPKSLIVGFNFNFGCGGTGNISMLRSLGSQDGIQVNVVAPVYWKGILVSSSTIRKALGEGDVATAAGMLGRLHRLRGVVVSGDRRGTSIGFPTANLCCSPDLCVPARGVYAGLTRIEGKQYGCMVNIGCRPTFGRDLPFTIEVHLLGFTGQLYGEHLHIDLAARLRQECRFGSVNELVTQLAKDKEKTRGILAGLGFQA